MFQNKQKNGEVEDYISLYKECSKIPSPVSAIILPNSGNNINLHSKWNVRDITRSETVLFSQNYVGKKNLDESFSFHTVGVPVESASETLCSYSPMRTSYAVLRKVVNKKGEEKQYIEIWNQNSKIKTIDVQEIEVHGKIYDDGKFGCLEWSHNEDRLLYIAEQKKVKSKSFFKQRHKEDIDENKQEIKMGMEDYNSEEDWGENLVAKHHSVVCIINIISEDVVVLDSIPDDVSPGQAIWSLDDNYVVCIGWKELPRRLGIVYCGNRRCGLYCIDLETAKCTMLSEEDRNVHSPRFSLDGNILIFLENDSDGPHRVGNRLMKCDWKTKEISIIVDTVKSPKEKEFPGIYAFEFPAECWTKNNNYVIFHTIWRSHQEIILVNIMNGKIKLLTEDEKIGTWKVMDIWNNKIVACCSSPNKLPHIKFGELNINEESFSILWYTVDNVETSISDIHWSVITLNPPVENRDYPDLDYEAILIKPVLDTSNPLPLIICIHGGPHSAFTICFQLYSLLFARCGFCSLQINYRGSLGYGENSIYSLLGNIGTQDVQDVHHAVEKLIEKENIDKNKLILFGGSHGGFIAAHLCGQYPDFYKLSICRNPVIDISGKIEVSDIPDWSWIECGLKKFYFNDVATPDILKIMWEKSPIKYIKNVKIPVLLLIGRNDRRVPSSQGVKYYNILKARQIPTRLIMYDDCHALSKVDVEADSYIQCMLWIKQHL